MIRLRLETGGVILINPDWIVTVTVNKQEKVVIETTTGRHIVENSLTEVNAMIRDRSTYGR
jgi:hypothetical protein